MRMRQERGCSHASGKDSRASDSLNRDILKSLAERLLQSVESVVSVREDALLVVEIHQSSSKPITRDTVLKQGRAKEHGIGTHQCFQMI